MANLQSLAPEILQQIGRAIVDRHDGSPGYNYVTGSTCHRTLAQVIYAELACLARSCRKLHDIFHPLLYIFAASVRDPRVLMLAAQDNNVRAMKILLENGHYPSRALRILVQLPSIGILGFPGTLPGCCGSVNDLQANRIADGRNQQLLSRVRMSRPNFSNAPRNVGGIHWLGDERLNPPLAIEQTLEWMEKVARRTNLGPTVQGDDDPQDKIVFWTPLHAAAANGHVDTLKLLLDHGADIEALSCGYCFCLSTAELSVDASADPALTENPQMPLPRHIYQRWWEPVEWTPLHHAICHGQLESAKYLLSRGASVRVGGKENPVTAAHFAAGMGSTELLKEILFSPDHRRYGINVTDSNNFSPFYWAQRNGRWDTTAKWLANNGAAVDQHIYPPPVPRRASMTALSEALLWRRYGVAEALLQLGADSGDDGEPDCTPLEALCQRPYPCSRQNAADPSREPLFLRYFYEPNLEDVFRFDSKVEEHRCKLILKLGERLVGRRALDGPKSSYIERGRRAGLLTHFSPTRSCPERTTPPGCSALMLAVKQHMAEAVKCILADASEPTSPFAAAIKCNESMLTYLSLCLAGLRQIPYRTMSDGLKTLECLLDYAGKRSYGVETVNKALYMLLNPTETMHEDNLDIQSAISSRKHEPVTSYKYFGDAIRLVVTKGANPRHFELNGRSAFLTAFLSCDVKALEILLETGNPKPSDLEEMLLHEKWKRAHHAMLDDAFQVATRSRLVGDNWRTVRSVLVKAWESEGDRRACLSETAMGLLSDTEVQLRTAHSDEVLIWACLANSEGWSDVLTRMALEWGANVNCVIKRPVELKGASASELSPLMAAISFNYLWDDTVLSVTQLLEAGANPLLCQDYESPVDSSKVLTTSALEWMAMRPWLGAPDMWACWCHTKVVSLFLANYPDCLRPQPRCTIRGHSAHHALGETIVHRVVMPDKEMRWPRNDNKGIDNENWLHAPLLTDMIERLIRYGADTSKPDTDNDTPLGLFLSLLLENPARLIRTRLKFDDGQKALDPKIQIALIRDNLQVLHHKNLDINLVSRTDGLSVAQKLERLMAGNFEVANPRVPGSLATKEMIQRTVATCLHILPGADGSTGTLILGPPKLSPL